MSIGDEGREFMCGIYMSRSTPVTGRNDHGTGTTWSDTYRTDSRFLIVLNSSGTLGDEEPNKRRSFEIKCGLETPRPCLFISVKSCHDSHYFLYFATVPNVSPTPIHS